MWGVPARMLPEGVEARLLAELTCIPNEKHVKLTPWRKVNSFCLGYRKDDVLWLPPWYACQVFPNAALSMELTLGVPMNASVKFTGTLRSQPPQRQAAATYMAWWPKHRGTPSCILSLPCGYGKTVLCIGLLVALKRRALVLAHTNALVDQWLQELRAFTSSEARFGFIKESGAIMYKDCDVVVASLASLLSHLRSGAEYLKELLPTIGTVVLDEGHHAVATTFWEVLCSIPAALRLVLTATPRRRDGLMNQLSWVTGPVVFRVERTTGAVQVVHVEFTGPGHEDLPMSKRHIMVQRLCSDAARTHLAVSIAAYLVHTQSRRVVIVTHLREHVNVITEAANEALTRLGVAPRVVPVFHPEAFRKPRRKPGATDAEDHALALEARAVWEATAPHGDWRELTIPLAASVRAGCSTLERDTAFEAHIVVATFTMLAEGVSYKKWDTLLDLGNTPDCEQVVGRILRECPSKRVPLVVDFWMNLGTFAGAHWARRRYYKREGFRQRGVQAASSGDLPLSMWDMYNVGVDDADRPGFVWPRLKVEEDLDTGTGDADADADADADDDDFIVE